MITVEKRDVQVLRNLNWIEYVFPRDRDLTKDPLYKCSDDFRNKNGKVKPHWVGHKADPVGDKDDIIKLLNYYFIKDGTIGLSGDLKKTKVFPTVFRK